MGVRYIANFQEELKMATCFFIGHREAPDTLLFQLTDEIKRHITEYAVTDFAVGRYRKNLWIYDKQLCKQLNQVERLFCHIKRFRRIFTRYDKLDVIFLAFVYFALIVDALM